MNQLNEKKDRLEKEIEDELRKIEKLQEELRRRKERVENLQKELKEISEQIRKAKGKGKVNEIPKNNKRKNTEEFINKKKKRTKVFQEELMNEATNEEEVDEETIQQEELITLFKKAYKYEIKKNRKMIEYWCNYAMKFEERVIRIMTDNKEERRTAISLVYKEIREQLPNLTKENLWKKTEGARKANFIFTALEKGEIKKMKKISMDWITRTCWDDIEEFVIEERAKRSEGKIQILEEVNEERMIEN